MHDSRGGRFWRRSEGAGWRGAKKNQNNRDFGLRLMIDLAVDADNIKAAAGSCLGNRRLCVYPVRFSLARSIRPCMGKNTTFGIQHVRVG
ncbi:unnamed protein product [Macrosiphum euphorbiae]|uniref:Uncharacterized protein n=1 Tax=Macrosiphum euphorbiae TaxID=13131 RepID=A0AAV0XAS0_9HEMI|nr:unnamed protein product [Macrosiphum euphorbiae]